MDIATLISTLLSGNQKEKQEMLPPMLGPRNMMMRKAGDITALRRKYHEAMMNEDYEAADELQAQIDAWEK